MATGAALVVALAVMQVRTTGRGEVIPVAAGVRAGAAGPSSPERLPGPHFIATALPEGYRPLLQVDNPMDSPTAAESVQRFAVGAGALIVLVDPIGEAAGAQQRPGTSGAAMGWRSPGQGRFEALETVNARPVAFAEGLSNDEALAALGGLIWRSGDPMDGFDLAPDRGKLVSEQIWPRGTAKPPFASTYYVAPGQLQPSIVISATAPAGVADLGLIISYEGSTERVAMAGAERVVSGRGAGDGSVQSVSWFEPDGTFLTVRARGLSIEQLESVVSGVTRAQDAAWSSVRAEISNTIAALPVADTVEWGDLVLTFHGEKPDHPAMQGQWQPDGACIRTRGGPAACSAFLEARDGLIGPRLTMGSGWTETTTWTIQSGQYLTTIATADGWWVLGRHELAAFVSVAAEGPSVTEQHSSPLDGLGSAFAAHLPAGAPAATLTATYEGFGPAGTDTSGATIPHWRVAVTRPS